MDWWIDDSRPREGDRESHPLATSRLASQSDQQYLTTRLDGSCHVQSVQQLLDGLTKLTKMEQLALSLITHPSGFTSWHKWIKAATE